MARDAIVENIKEKAIDERTYRCFSKDKNVFFCDGSYAYKSFQGKGIY